MLPQVILADPELRPYVEQCCEIIGCFVHPEHYLPLLLPFFEDAIAVDHSKTAPTLAVLAHLVWGAGPKLAVNPPPPPRKKKQVSSAHIAQIPCCSYTPHLCETPYLNL